MAEQRFWKARENFHPWHTRMRFIGIDSETDHLPVGKVREHWAADALEAKDAEITIAEERWKARFRDVCERIAEPSSVDRDE